ncbi:MAG: phenylalanine--tRNA ligase subunit alpha [Clostridia bacterium]|nr:phenylalanine--tRNA ligase subunit alpha [Clostridia bacterium]
MLKEKINQITALGLEAVANAKNSQELNDIRVKYLGKSGEVTSLLKSLKDVPNAEKPAMGKLINDVKVKIEGALTQAEATIALAERKATEEKERLDVTLSKDNLEQGALHPLTLVKNEMLNIFMGLGFSVADGPEIDYTKYNFELLNIPQDHPARDFGDSFYINPEILLRTQTSCVQARVMEVTKPPIRIVCPGKVYRPDDDATHSPMFQQLEGLVVDEHITLADLKGTLEQFAKKFFSSSTKVRFRPSYFPFTEPSVEVDLSCAMCGGKGCRLCKGTGWIELLGAGVVNPAVLDACGIDSKKYTGYAFGVGIERATMIKYSIPDMRLLFDNDIRYAKQFK